MATNTIHFLMEHTDCCTTASIPPKVYISLIKQQPAALYPTMFREKSISTLIKKKKWRKVHAIIQKGRIQDEILERNDGNSLVPECSILTLAVCHHAPVTIIRSILQQSPTISLACDNYGYLPIHYACTLGSSLEIIELLIDHDNGASARALTSFGNSPLHCIVERICNPRSDGQIPANFYSLRSSNITNVTGADVSMIDVSAHAPESDEISCMSMNQDQLNRQMESIEFLCVVAPEMVRYVNQAGMTPIDILQEVKAVSTGAKWERADIVYQGLRRVNIQLYRDQKKLYELSSKERGDVCPSLASSNVSSSVSSSLSGGISAASGRDFFALGE